MPHGRQRWQRLVRGESRAGFRGFFLLNDANHLRQRRLLEPLGVDRPQPRQQFVQNHAQRVDVGPGVDVDIREARLLRRHVFQRPDDRAEAGRHRLFGQFAGGRLGHTKVDHLRYRATVHHRHQDVGRLEITMHDPLCGARVAPPGRSGRRAPAVPWASASRRRRIY